MSARKYDLETFRDDIVSMVQANLSAKVTAINAEKNDAYNISDIDLANYYNDITDQVTNANPFIYYGMSDLVMESVGAGTAIEATIFISVVFDNTNDVGVESKVLRYTRCLVEIIQENFKKIPNLSPLKVTQFLPANYSLNNGSDFKIGGIHVTATLAA